MSATVRQTDRNERGQKPIFEFTIILSGIDDVTDEIANVLYDSGCDDALLGMENGQVYLDFAREAESPNKAIAAALQDVNGANIEGLEVLEVRIPGTIASRM